jgi:hypothetical protein
LRPFEAKPFQNAGKPMAGLAMVWPVTRDYGLAGFAVCIRGQFVNVSLGVRDDG